MEYCVICETYGIVKEATTHVEIYGDKIPVCKKHKEDVFIPIKEGYEEDTEV